MSDYPIEGGLFLQACEALIVNNTFTIPLIDRLQTPQSLIHDNSAQTTTDIIYGHHVNVEDESEDRVTADQASPDDLSINELMTMTYSELLPEIPFYPWRKLLGQKARTSVSDAVIRYGENQR